MSGDPLETPEVVEIFERFWLRQAVDNIAWADLGGFAVAVDAGEKARGFEKSVFGAMEKTLADVPVRHLINTHTHYDHVGLNDAFARRGAKIVNAETRDIGPDGLWIEGERRRVHIIPMGGCHTHEDCVLWIPEDRILFVGDLFGWGLIPTGFLDEDMARRLLETYQKLIGFEAAVVVPGHGPRCTTAELRRWVEYFNWLREEIARAVTSGARDEEILKQLSAPDDMVHWWRFVQWKHADSVGKVVRMVRRGR